MALKRRSWTLEAGDQSLGTSGQTPTGQGLPPETVPPKLGKGPRARGCLAAASGAPEHTQGQMAPTS